MSASNTILMVDDNPDFVELAKRAFHKAGISNPIVVAENGTEALDYLYCTGTWADRDPKDMPIFVLLDLKLPMVSGLEVLRHLRADPRTRRLPVIIMTTSVEEQDVISAYDLGCNSYVRKPVDFTRLAESVRQLGLYWLVVNEPPILDGGG